MTNKNLTIAVFIIGLIAIGAYFYPKVNQMMKTGSAVGTTFNSAKVAAINMTISTGTATSSSLYNSDGSDRYIIDAFSVCSGVATSYTAYTGTGLASLNWKMATTSTSAPAILTNTNYVANMNMATTTSVAMASSTVGDLATGNRTWAAGTYLTIQPNATNTAACTAGVHYIGS